MYYVHCRTFFLVDMLTELELEITSIYKKERIELNISTE